MDELDNTTCSNIKNGCPEQFGVGPSCRRTQMSRSPCPSKASTRTQHSHLLHLRGRLPQHNFLDRLKDSLNIASMRRASDVGVHRFLGIVHTKGFFERALNQLTPR